MSKALSSWLGLSLCILGCFCATNNPVSAQVTSDDTVNTQVTENGSTAEITGGERAGDNLFHSFQDFSVGTGNEASFLNANDISNIFSRVTGGNISNIDGLISANGSANLFLINPAGIIFGENARLDVGGSFYGSSASSILFEDGEFSATDLDNPPLLTINAPIGLGFRDQPGDITVMGNGQGTRQSGDALIDPQNALRVNSDKTFALIGGKLNLDGATIKTPGGRIELGSVQGNQEVRLTPVNEGFSLDYAEVQNFQDIQLSKTATIDASGLVAGDIQVQGNNISLAEGSQIEASTIGNSPSQETPGTVKVNAADTIKIDGLDSSNSFPSAIVSQVYSDAVGNSGQLNITTANLSLANSGQVNANTFGKGNAGSIDINATKSVTLNDESVADDDYNSFISSGVDGNAEGNGGKVNITTANLTLNNGVQIYTSTYGKGDAGSIDINATESIALNNSTGNRISSTVEKNAQGNGGELNITTPNLSLTNYGLIETDTDGKGDAGSININAPESITLDDSDISSTVGIGVTGNGGELNITTPNLSLTNDSSIDVNTFGQGNAGKLSINTANLYLNGGSSINGDTFGQGDASSIEINATQSITLDDSDIFSSVTIFGEGNGGNIQISTGNFSILNNATVDASTSVIGNGGDINITANNLSLTNGGYITASTSGINAENIAQGDGGNITIDVADTLSINGATTVDSSQTAGIFASNEGNSSGNAGNIDITASKLSLINGGQINSYTRDRGNAGNTTINAQDSIFLSGENSEGFASGIINGVYETARVNGGTINITTNNLGVFNGATISAFSEGQGDGGLIDINANILSLDNGEISAQAFNDANGGNLEIDADVIAAFPNGNSDIRASAEQGEGGNITIDAESLFGIEERPLNDSTNDINASSQFSLDGTININTSSINPVQGATELPSNVVEVEQNTAQACEAGREGTANNGLAIAGKGGVTPAPNTPLNSENIISPEQNPSAFAIPEPIETSQGKIQPARGITVTKSGHIVLTAYRTNNAGERIPESQINCGQR
jgi:filamentous hemagglutinin family protein